MFSFNTTLLGIKGNSINTRTFIAVNKHKALLYLSDSIINQSEGIRMHTITRNLTVLICSFNTDFAHMGWRWNRRSTVAAILARLRPRIKESELCVGSPMLGIFFIDPIHLRHYDA